MVAAKGYRMCDDASRLKGEMIQFVTGRLAERALRDVLQRIAQQNPFSYTVQVLPISVAALMSPAWIQRHIQVADGVTRVLVPGYCGGDLSVLSEAVGVPVERGPRDLRQLPEFLGHAALDPPRLTDYSIQIIAEINHAPRLSRDNILKIADRYATDGADLIDVGCEPGEPWTGVADCVRALRDRGHRVSIDSLQPAEIEPAVRAGAELVLSVNASNREAALDWGCEVVVIPDNLNVLDSFDQTIELLVSNKVPVRLDPILEPIGMGVAASLWRYMDIRRLYPEHHMMMGIGNITELTDVDSAGLNVLLLGLCQELGIGSVLTTEVINWARTSVRECDLARRLVHYAVTHQVPPKNLMQDLLLLRDGRLMAFAPEQLEALARQIKDYNVRLLAEGGQLHALRAGKRFTESDPFALFEQLLDDAPDRMDVTHAFYLGFEMCKAAVALHLGKSYQQDEALDWGFLTVPEQWHRIKRDR
jgi:dihydropteroate synthase-like protein